MLSWVNPRDLVKAYKAGELSTIVKYIETLSD